MSYFEEDVPKCEERCDICCNDSGNQQKDCTAVATLSIQGFETVLEEQKKINVLFLSRFLQRLIYHLIVIGVIKKELAGIVDKPTILLSKGNSEKITNNHESIFF